MIYKSGYFTTYFRFESKLGCKNVVIIVNFFVLIGPPEGVKVIISMDSL